MIDLYTWSTPNGRKVSIMLEECKLDYNLIPINIIKDEQFEEKVPDSTERIKFVLASYNVGLGHIFDAMRLAEKYDLDSQKWKDNVAEMILKKSYPEYYRDDVVYYGYCRGSETYKYVNEIYSRFEHYQNVTQ